MKAPEASITPAKGQVTPASVEEEIRCRAYQIYEEGGRIDGHEMEHWLQAEQEIMTHKALRKAA